MKLKRMQQNIILILCTLILTCLSCQTEQKSSSSVPEVNKSLFDGRTPISSPLIDHLYTADPSAHVFNGRIYIYPSHDVESQIPENDKGDQFDMKDYHVFSMDKIGTEVIDHGVALAINDIPWASRQLWAPDAAYKNGTYYLYFPAKDKEGIFRIGVATSDSPTGPFKAMNQPIKKSFSIDPAVFQDDNGDHYMYFGGIWGGQLQHWPSNQYSSTAVEPKSGETAIGPRVAKLRNDMLEFDGDVKEITILDKSGSPILSNDNARRFFEAAWMHKYDGKYYLSYSTGDTHLICYAIGNNPYGPFTYQGVVLNPVLGWTNHHSIVEVSGKWYLFYHDSELSGGKTPLRSVKVTSLTHLPDGTIKTIDPYVK
jgi:hypothetical protein